MIGRLQEPHILCPNCSHQIPLTESIAAPLLEVERREFAKKLAAREAEFTRRADELRLQSDELARAREGFEEQITQRLGTEREQIIAAEARKARQLVASDLDAVTQRLAESEQLLEARSAKLAEAQQAQADALRKQRELDEKTRELEVTVEKRVQASQGGIIAKTRQDAADEFKSQVSQKDAQIDSLGRTVEELKRKLEQGSQQTQGGSRFKQRIEAIVERFKDMRDDIDKERKFMVKPWAKREAQVSAMIESTVGMVGDLHGIMGQAMPEISAIEEPPLLEGKAA